MDIEIRYFQKKDIPSMVKIWNEAVNDGGTLPQEKPLTEKEAASFFGSQTSTCIAADSSTGVVIGLYILHPNGTGHCRHIANASYVVWSVMRHKGIGRKLVQHSLLETKRKGFRLLQFNAVVSTNTAARKLYDSMNFRQLGILPGGYRNTSGEYIDTVLYYHDLSDL